MCWRWYFLESICQTCLTSSIVIWTMTCKRFYWNWKPHQITEFVKSSFKRFETTKAVPMPTIKIFINYSSNDNNKQLCQSENNLAKDYFFFKNILNRDNKSRYGDVFARRRVNGGELKLWTSLKVLLTAEPASRISHPVCFVNLILLNQLLKLSSMPWQYFIIDLYAPKRTPYIALPHFSQFTFVHIYF